MHELSIAMEVLDIVRREASVHSASAVTIVRLRIGDLSGVEAESLSFCFDAVKGEHPLTLSTGLIIESVPVSIKCESCDNVSDSPGVTVTCPACGGCDTRLITGGELEISDFEIE